MFLHDDRIVVDSVVSLTLVAAMQPTAFQPNIEAFRLLLSVFESTEGRSSMKSELLHTIRSVLNLYFAPRNALSVPPAAPPVESTRSGFSLYNSADSLA